MVLDLASLRQSSFASVFARTRLPTFQAKSVRELVAGCAFDPARDVDRLLVSGHAVAADKQPVMMVLQGRFDEGPLMTCMRANAARQKLVMRDESVHGHTIHHLGNDTILFQSSHTVAVGPEEWTARLAGELPAAGPPAVEKLAAGIDTNQPVWWIGIEDPAKPQGFHDMTGAMRPATTIAIHVLVHFYKAADATSAVNQASSVKQMLSSSVTSLEAKAEGELGTFDVTLNAAQAEKLFPMFTAGP
jgi:hypothetical protein